MTKKQKSSRQRSVANDIIDSVEAATSKWTKQKKSEERQPGNIRYRRTRMTKEPRTSQKKAAWEVLGAAYMAASANGTLPAMARQIFYQARPKIMAMTDNKELQYNYFSQVLLPNYIEEKGVTWNVVYDARGHFSEPHTNRHIGCGTIEVGEYLGAIRRPEIVPAGFASADIEIIGPSGNISAVLFCEKEGFNPLFKAVNLANRYDLMIISTKGVSVTAARRLIDKICGNYHLPLFVLHDFDVAGFMIFGTLQRDTRRYQFSNSIKVIDLGMRLDDIEDLEREPAAPTKTNEETLRDQLAANGATEEEIEILLEERVELNAMTSDALVEMIESKLDAYGLEKVIPGDEVLAGAYRAFHRSQQLRTKFEEIEKNYDDEKSEIEVPEDLKEQVCSVLDEHSDLRWDNAIQVVLDGTQLDRVREEKQKAARKAGNFTGDDDSEYGDDDDGELEDDDDDGGGGASDAVNLDRDALKVRLGEFANTPLGEAVIAVFDPPKPNDEEDDEDIDRYEPRNDGRCAL